MGKKSLALKRWLAKKQKQNRRVPAFVTAKTKRRVSRPPTQRRWRSDKLNTRRMRRILGNK